MPVNPIPQREPINELLSGTVSRVDGFFFLSSSALPQAEIIVQGEIALRYGIPYLFKPQWSIVPDLVVLDYGQTMTGEAAWGFLMESSHLYPRSDVLGFRSDGADEMVPLKQLDFDSPYDVFVYRAPGDREPVARLSALIESDSEFPERLLQHLPRFPSLGDWLSRG
ncbi:MAG: hypothetical protein OXG39_04140 [Chloroflexi bacterium]|nr:hypothetical protein [Chloroflexota bacterium]